MYVVNLLTAVAANARMLVGKIFENISGNNFPNDPYFVYQNARTTRRIASCENGVPSS